VSTIRGEDHRPGIYGFDLFDREGAFGKPEALLATHLYSIAER
jgi:hypothetical protein